MRISWSVGGDVTPESEPADPSIRSNHEPHMTYTPTLQHALSRAQVPVVRLQLNKGEKKKRREKSYSQGESGWIFHTNSNIEASTLHLKGIKFYSL